MAGRRNIIRVLLLTIIPFFTARAQQYTITNLTGPTGPSCTQVNTIYLDPDSLLWLGTGNTVERYDGTDYLCYSFREETQYKGENVVTALVRTSRNEYWAGNLKGLWKLNHQTRMLDRVLADEIKVPVNKLSTDAAGTLYIGTTNGLYIYGNEHLNHILFDKTGNTQDNQVVDMQVCDSEKVYWLLPDGVIFCNPVSGVTNKYPFRQQAEYGKFTCSMLLGDSLYIGTEKKGVVTFDVNSLVYTPFMNAWKSAVTCLSCGSGDIMGVGTANDGVDLVSRKKRHIVYSARSYNTESQGGLVSNAISSLLMVGNDAWIGTEYYLGWSHLTHCDTMFSLYGAGNFSSGDVPVRSFLHTDEYTFIGTRDGFHVIDELHKSIRSYAVGTKGAEALRSNLIFSFCHYDDQYLVARAVAVFTGSIPTPENFRRPKSSNRWKATTYSCFNATRTTACG